MMNVFILTEDDRPERYLPVDYRLRAGERLCQKVQHWQNTYQYHNTADDGKTPITRFG
jgi:hypothetical protein